MTMKAMPSKITDFAPRFIHYDRTFRQPGMGAGCAPNRRAARASASGCARCSIWCERAPEITRGSNHKRFVGPGQALRR